MERATRTLSASILPLKTSLTRPAIIEERNRAETKVPDYGGANYPTISLEIDIFPLLRSNFLPD